MAEQKRLKNFAIAKPKDLPKDKLPKKYKDTPYVFAEPKLDGLRGIVIVKNGKSKLYTSTGVRVHNGPSIEKALKTMGAPDGVYDGEFFAGNWNLSNSIVKKQSPDHPKRERLGFRVFDYLTPDEWLTKTGTVPLVRRKTFLNQLKFGKYVQQVPHKQLPTKIDLMNNYAIGVANTGMEGAVFKHPESVYQFKRSDDWLKWKPVKTADLRVVTVQEGAKKYVGMLGALIVEGKIGKQKIKTKVGGGYTDVQRTKFWKMWNQGKLKGRIVEVAYDTFTVGGALRFPRFRRLRSMVDKNVSKN